MQSSIAKPSPFLRQRIQPVAQRAVVQPCRAVANARPGRCDHSTRPSLTHLMDGLQVRRSLPMRGGRSPFFSQEVFQRDVVEHGVPQHPLQPRILVLQHLSRLASDTSRPPSLAFHL